VTFSKPRGSGSQRGYGWAWAKVRAPVAEAGIGRPCPVCGTTMTRQTVSVDHKIARRLGGSDHPSNLRAVCRSCNTKLGAALGEALARSGVRRQADTSVPSVRSREW
jgi:5-methylcytosine-specific restriction endonuclease McrA